MNGTQITLEQLNPKISLTQTATVSDFHAKVSALLETEAVSAIQEALCFLRSCGWLKSESLKFYSQKMSGGYSIMTVEEPSERLYEQWMNWGTMSNGSYLTANTLGCHRTGKECSLSDILEEEVDEKYFLSENAMNRLLSYKDNKAEPLQREPGGAASVGTYIASKRLSQEVNQIGNIVDDTDIGFKNPQRGRIYDKDGISPCLSTMQGGGLEPKIIVKEAAKKGYMEAYSNDSVNIGMPNSETRRGRVGRGIANTLTTQQDIGVVVEQPKIIHVYNKKERSDGLCGTLTASGNTSSTHCGTFGIINDCRIRKLTPKECFRLQGFPDEYFERAASVNSDSQLYKQAGNSVTVNVIYEIAKRL